MKTQFILDSSAIISNPEILSIDDASSLYVPYAVLKEVGRNSSRFSALLKQAVSRGATVEFQRTRFGTKKPNTDAEIVATALNFHYRKNSAEVAVVTLDLDLSNALYGTDVECISPSEFLNRHVGKKRNEHSTELATGFRRSLLFKFVRQILIGVLCILLAYALIANYKLIIISTPVWGTILAIPVLGMGVFWLRQNFRLSYGITEFGVGILSVYFVFFPKFDYSQIEPIQLLRIVAGIYIVVRGLDNIGKGLERTRFAPHWNRLFGERG